MPERLKCKACGIEWTYFGYPAYSGCPNCGSHERDLVEHEEKCPHCGGTGKIMTNEVHEPLYDDCTTDVDADRISKEILKRERGETLK